MAKRLKDMRLLDGQHAEITAMDFRRAPGDVLAQVALGKTFTITKNGKPVAVISKPELTALEIGAEARRLGLVK